jgi:hypothetical protein
VVAIARSLEREREIQPRRMLVRRQRYRAAELLDRTRQIASAQRRETQRIHRFHVIGLRLEYAREEGLRFEQVALTQELSRLFEGGGVVAHRPASQAAHAELAYAVIMTAVSESGSSLHDLRYYVRVYDGDLEPAFCEKIVASFAGLERFHQRNGRTLRAGLQNSAWTELNVTRLSDAAFLGFFRMRIDQALAAYNRDVGLTIPVPNSPKTADLILKRYRPGQDEQFQLHFDAVNHLAHRYLVMLWYLNDVAAGGETRFPQLDVTIRPKAGRLIIFPPYWMYQHEGVAPVSGDKYILSTYLLFTTPAAPHSPNAQGMPAPEQ